MSSEMPSHQQTPACLDNFGAGQGRAGQVGAGRAEWAWEGRAGQSRARQFQAGQNEAEQDRAKQGKAGPGRRPASMAADCVGSYCFLMKSRKAGVLASEGHMR